MNNKQKEIRIDEIKKHLSRVGFIENAYGNYEIKKTRVKFKFGKNSLQKFVRDAITNRWIKVYSAYYKDVIITNIDGISKMQIMNTM